MSRLSAKLREMKLQGRKGLIAFLTVGYPNVEATLSLVPALVDGGVDVIELGVPFSDPLADGATIQKTSFLALEQKVSLNTCLDVCVELRRRGVVAPLVLMSYYNPILSYGHERFSVEGAKAGVDGVVVVDLPPEEAGPFKKACDSQGVEMVFLLTPTSSEERIGLVCQVAKGFIYCVSITGVTGARKEVSRALPSLVARIKDRTDIPVAVGFGVSTRTHVEEIYTYADAVVVGSALLDVIGSASPKGIAEMVRKAKAYVAELSGVRRTSPGEDGRRAL